MHTKIRTFVFLGHPNHPYHRRHHNQLTTYRKGYRKKEQSVLPLVFLKRHTQMRHDFEWLEGCSLLTFTIENQHFVTTLNVLFQSSDLEID